MSTPKLDPQKLMVYFVKLNPPKLYPAPKKLAVYIIVIIQILKNSHKAHSLLAKIQIPCRITPF